MRMWGEGHGRSVQWAGRNRLMHYDSSREFGSAGWRRRKTMEAARKGWVYSPTQELWALYRKLPWLKRMVQRVNSRDESTTGKQLHPLWVMVQELEGALIRPAKTIRDKHGAIKQQGGGLTVLERLFFNAVVRDGLSYRVAAAQVEGSTAESVRKDVERAMTKLVAIIHHE